MHDNPKKSPSSKKQRQLIAIGCNELGIDAEARHEMLQQRFGVDSSTKLTLAQAEGFLAELKGRGFVVRSKLKRDRARAGRPGVKREKGAPVLALASAAELEKIQALAGLIAWRFADGLERWMKARLGIARVRTEREAYLVIEGLKKMFENKMKKDFGPDWWVLVYEDPAIEQYKTEHCPVKRQPMMLFNRQQAAKTSSKLKAESSKGKAGFPGQARE